MARDPDKALSVIGKTLGVKEQIDKDFDLNEVIKETEPIEEFSPKDKKPVVLSYSINNDYFGLNGLANFNPGRAYYLKDNEDGHKFEYNISPNAKRVKFSPDELHVYNEKWIDHVLSTIKNSERDKNVATIILENMFTKVTTGNYTEILPYKLQTEILYKKLEEHNIADKIVAMVTNDFDEPFVKKIAEKLKIEDKVVPRGVLLNFEVNDQYKKKVKISATGFYPSGNVRAKIYQQIDKYAKTIKPGFDIYWNTSAKITGQYEAITYVMEDGKRVEKPCLFLFFGPMCEYDLFNAKRPLVGPYCKNKDWYRIGFETTIRNGQPISKLVAHFNDYNYPHEQKTDEKNYVSSVVADNIGDMLNNLKSYASDVLDNVIEDVVLKARRSVNITLRRAKKLVEEEQGKNPRKLIKQIKTKEVSKPKEPCKE